MTQSRPLSPRTRRKLRWLSVMQVLLAISLFGVWFRVGTWSGAMTPAEAKKEGLVVPKRWRGVVVGGGSYSEWPYRTISENPWGFAFWAGLLSAIIAILLLSALYAARLIASEPRQHAAEPSIQ